MIQAKIKWVSSKNVYKIRETKYSISDAALMQHLNILCKFANLDMHKKASDTR